MTTDLENTTMHPVLAARGPAPCQAAFRVGPAGGEGIVMEAHGDGDGQAGGGGWHTGPEALGWLGKEAGGWRDRNAGRHTAGRADPVKASGI